MMETVVNRGEASEDLRRSAELLSCLMNSLSPQQRTALDLVELQGFSTSETAEMLEISPATVRVHLHRAKQALREHGERGAE
jgi:RNA polymerase sigma-70 factor (ECF subfamily)